MHAHIWGHSNSYGAADRHHAVDGLVHAAIGAGAADVLALPDGSHLPCLHFLHAAQRLLETQVQYLCTLGLLELSSEML